MRPAQSPMDILSYPILNFPKSREKDRENESLMTCVSTPMYFYAPRRVRRSMRSRAYHTRVMISSSRRSRWQESTESGFINSERAQHCVTLRWDGLRNFRDRHEKVCARVPLCSWRRPPWLTCSSALACKIIYSDTPSSRRCMERRRTSDSESVRQFARLILLISRQSASVAGSFASPSTPSVPLSMAKKFSHFPTFWKNTPELWIEEIEKKFNSLGNTSDREKFHYTITSLGSDIIAELADSTRNLPKDNRKLVEALESFRVSVHTAISRSPELEPYATGFDDAFTDIEQLYFEADSILRISVGRCIYACAHLTIKIVLKSTKNSKVLSAYRRRPLDYEDAPARAAVQGVMQFNGYYGCNWCLHPGVSDGALRYPVLDPVPAERTHEDTLHKFVTIVVTLRYRRTSKSCIWWQRVSSVRAGDSRGAPSPLRAKRRHRRSGPSPLRLRPTDEALESSVLRDPGDEVVHPCGLGPRVRGSVSIELVYYSAFRADPRTTTQLARPPSVIVSESFGSIQILQKRPYNFSLRVSVQKLHWFHTTRLLAKTKSPCPPPRLQRVQDRPPPREMRRHRDLDKELLFNVLELASPHATVEHIALKRHRRVKKKYRMNSVRTDWAEVQRTLDEEYSHFLAPAYDHLDVTDKYKKILETITKAMSHTPTRKLVSKRKHINPVPWWDSECDNHSMAARLSQPSLTRSSLIIAEAKLDSYIISSYVH
ncbi:unnamed protein product [Trichogramma brassicae]|uniref:DUF7041 domain-containing protein n=1 Tax=Trichogramma brassicae TaxID=86971 RepID=A0A6H5IH55_9HYME|nr:unnamed protein product [Trichogramma brassicae]